MIKSPDNIREMAKIKDGLKYYNKYYTQILYSNSITDGHNKHKPSSFCLLDTTRPAC